MKNTKLIILAGLTIMLTNLYAQHNYEFVNQGSQIKAESGAIISVWGDTHVIGGTLENDGLIEVQGNMYSDNTFQQRGAGTVRFENNDVNSGERQFIAGSFAVRGNTSQIGVNDGSFYNLELANTAGNVYLVGSGNIADVRNAVDFQPAGASGSPVANNLITQDVGTTGAITYPANGANYTSVFGIMNTNAANASTLNSTVDASGNMSTVDEGYVIGQMRRAIDPTGGTYTYVLGLEPAGASSARGLQYIHLDFAANTYDIVTGYFEQGSSNAGTPQLECTTHNIDYFAGTDHGEWIFEDFAGSGTGAYAVKMWPQDHNAPNQNVWVITKDNAIVGTANECATSLVGLERSGFNGFSEFSFAGASTALPIELISFKATPVDQKYIRLNWDVATEINTVVYEIQRSKNGTDFETIGHQTALGTGDGQAYSYDDFQVLPHIIYYYRIKSFDENGDYELTHVESACLRCADAVESMNLYPNPTGADNFNVAIVSAQNRPIVIKAFDAIGQLILTQTTDTEYGLNTISIDASNWPAGAYFIQAQGKDFSQVKQLIKLTY